MFTNQKFKILIFFLINVYHLNIKFIYIYDIINRNINNFYKININITIN